MNVSTLYHASVISCSSRDSLEHVTSLMWRCDLGCLPVIDDRGRLVGVITDRDVSIAAYLAGAPLRSIVVSSVMTKDVISCCPADDIVSVIAKMTAHQVHRLPVTDDRGSVIGMISINDVARAARTGDLPASELVLALAAVTAPCRIAHRAA
jgi:CBS domain-containing protein